MRNYTGEAMISHRMLLVVCLSAVLILGASCAKEKGEGPAANAVNWLTSFDMAMAAARDKNLPVMVDFYTDWCGWCKRLDSDTYVDGQVIAAARGFVSVKVNADVDRATATKYGITGFPTILFVDSMGNEIHRIVGYRPPQAFLAEMNQALAAFEGRS
jgi:thiol:disulfide interchange protein